MSDQPKRPSRLGRGLSSLMAQPVAVAAPPTETLSGPNSPDTAAAVADGVPRGTGETVPSADVSRGTLSASDTPDAPGLRWVELDLISPNPDQPRQTFAVKSLETLAESIQSHGMMQPVVLRDAGSGRFFLVAGERRWRAAKIAGLGKLPALVRELNAQESAEWALIENVQREDLNPIERAEAFQKLVAKYDLAHDDVAGRVGLERSTVTNLIRLLKLEPGVRQLVADGLLSMGHARALLAVSDPMRQLQVAERVVREGWSVRQAETAARESQKGGAAGDSGKAVKAAVKSAWIRDLEQQVREQLGTKVTIKPGRKQGSGSITLDYSNLEDFDALMGKLGVKTG